MAGNQQKMPIGQPPWLALFSLCVKKIDILFKKDGKDVVLYSQALIFHVYMMKYFEPEPSGNFL